MGVVCFCFVLWLLSHGSFLCILDINTSLDIRIGLPVLEVQEMQVSSLSLKIPWSTKWQATPVFLPGKFHGQKSLMGYSHWGCKESDMTEHTHTASLLPYSGYRRIYLCFLLVCI